MEDYNYLNTDNPIYENFVKDVPNFFINNEDDEYLIDNNDKIFDDEDIDFSMDSDDDNEFSFNSIPKKNFNYIEDFLGGAISKKKKSAKTVSKIQKNSSLKKLKIMPTFINVLRENRKGVFPSTTMLQLKKMMPNNNSEVIVGTIIDFIKIMAYFKDKNIELTDRELTEEQLKEYIFSFDVIPVLFDFEHTKTIYKNSKQNFFSNSSRLIFITFKIKKERKIEYYFEDELSVVSDKAVDIDSVLDKSKNYLVAHIINHNHYLLVTNPSFNLRLHNCFEIDIMSKDNENTFIFKNIDFSKKNKIQQNNKILTLKDISKIISDSMKQLTTFSEE